MGVIKYDAEQVSSVPPAKLFKAFSVDFDSLVSKILPEAIKSIEVVEGEGGVGTVRLITFGDGNQFKNVKDKIEAIDTEKLTYSHSVIGGDILQGVLEKIRYDLKVEASPSGGSIAKATTTYHTIGDAQLTEDQIKNRERVGATFKAIEAYLVANPSYN